MTRLSKLIAAAGVASRRKAADLVRAGRVRVDGEVVTHPGTEVDESRARVEVDGRPVSLEAKVYLMLNKPRGPVSTAVDQRGRQTVLDLVPGGEERLYPAGRLDADTEGLLLITNDGDLTYRLTHPRFGIEKVYEAEVVGSPHAESLRRLEQGVVLEDGPVGPAKVRVLRRGRQSTLVELTVHAGRKRMVRRMFKAIGHPVLRLRRTRIGPLTLGHLPSGHWRRLTPAELDALRAATERAAPPGGAAQDGSRGRRPAGA